MKRRFAGFLTPDSRDWLNSPAVRVAFVFLVYGVLWIGLSDSAVQRLFSDPAAVALAQTVKGWFFVGVTTLLLYAVVAREMRRRQAAERARDTSAERERVALDRAESMRKWATDAIESMTDAFFALDAEWRFVYLNRRAEKHFGRSRDDLLGRVVWEAFPQARDSVFGRAYREAVESRRPVRVDARSLVARDRWLEVHVYPSERGLSIYLQDVTDRKEAELALREGEERYRLALRATNDIIWDWDPRSERLTVSDSMESVLGYPADEAGSHPGPDGFVAWWAEHIHPDDRDRVICGFRAAFDGAGDFWSATYRFRRADGEYADLLDRAFILRDDDGQPVRVVGSATDLSESRRLERQLRQAQKMEAVGQLAGGLAHDFNNLMQTVLGYADLLLDDLDDDGARADLDEIRNAAARASRLTRQLLVFSRDQPSSPEVVDLNDLVDNMKSMLRPLITAQIEFETVLDPGLGVVEADPGQLEQVIMNLAVNARDAMPDGGRFRIATRNETIRPDAAGAQTETPRPREYVVLEVSDTGVGMDAATRDKIFEPFFSTKAKDKGTGLGLSTVYGIVKNSGGVIRVHSRPGRGTRFEVLLPRIDTERREDDATRHDLSGRRDPSSLARRAAAAGS